MSQDHDAERIERGLNNVADAIRELTAAVVQAAGPESPITKQLGKLNLDICNELIALENTISGK